MQKNIFLELDEDEKEIYFDLVDIILNTEDYIEDDGLLYYIIYPKGENINCINQLLMGLSNCVSHLVNGKMVSDRLIEGVEYIEGGPAEIWVNPDVLEIVEELEAEWLILKSSSNEKEEFSAVDLAYGI